MGDERGRWVRIPQELREELADLNGHSPSSSLTALLELFERARPEDWIAQLVEVNRGLSDDVRRLQQAVSAADPRRRSA